MSDTRKVEKALTGVRPLAVPDIADIQHRHFLRIPHAEASTNR